MNILIIGSGGREHALAWKAAQSPLADKIFVAPGNAGTATEEGMENLAIPADDIKALRDFALQNDIGLTIVGPEQPLVAGIVDIFTAAGLKCFGAGKRAARLEGSKSFAKDFLERHQIPTAAYGSFTDIEEAIDFLRQQGAPIVIKADGLAAGKGVILAQDLETAEEAVKDMLSGNQFGDAGHKVVIEEFLEGEEASFIVMADGKNILSMASSQDHKAAYEGDAGPNTGGMGAYSPAPVVTPEIHDRIIEQVIRPTIDGMSAEGSPYTGFLYAGLMIDAEGTPKVIEFNCRFGDPEAQPIMMRMQSDLVAHCLAALEGKLDEEHTEWDNRAAVGVVLAAGGYPGSYESGDVIQGLDNLSDEADTKIFHAGTAIQDEQIVTSGGRVLCVTALGDSVTQAQHKAYALIEKISWNNMQYRKDIAHRAISREK